MKQLIIEKQPTTPTAKTRRFSATLMSYVTADTLWEGGQTKTTETRPIYITMAGSLAALRPFLANFHSKGERANLTDTERRWGNDSHWFRCLKTGNYEAIWQRGTHADGEQLVTLFQRPLFEVDPGMIDPHTCQFLSKPPRWWCDEQLAMVQADRELCGRVLDHAHWLKLGAAENRLKLTVTFDDNEVIATLPLAAHFMMCLDKRTRRPLINHLDFAVQLYLAALQQGYATTSSDSGWSWAAHKWGRETFKEVGTGNFARGVIFSSTHDVLDALLADQIKLYSQKEQAHG